MHARRCAAVAKGRRTSSFFAASCAIPAGNASCPRHARVRVRMRCAPRCPTAKRIARRSGDCMRQRLQKAIRTNATQATARRQQDRDNSAADDTQQTASTAATWRRMTSCGDARAADNFDPTTHRQPTDLSVEVKPVAVPGVREAVCKPAACSGRPTTGRPELQHATNRTRQSHRAGRSGAIMRGP